MRVLCKHCQAEYALFEPCLIHKSLDKRYFYKCVPSVTLPVVFVIEACGECSTAVQTLGIIGIAMLAHKHHHAEFQL